MSGKRILDAIALLRVSRNIAVKHFEIRFSQVDLYTKTSSLFKAGRQSQISAVSVAAKNFSQAASKASRNLFQNEHIPSDGTAPSSNPSRSHDEGVQQDHFYDKSAQHSTADLVPNDSLDVTQAKAKRQPLPDGTISPEDVQLSEQSGDSESFSKRPLDEGVPHTINESNEHALNLQSSGRSSIPDADLLRDLTPEKARKLQRQSEDQIPRSPAEPPKGNNDASLEGIGEFSVEQEKDIYYQPPDATSPVLSALPRTRVPKTENDVQADGPHLPKGINGDTFYSGTAEGAAEDEPTEEQLSQMFHTPRIARMLGKKDKNIPGGIKKQSFHTSSTARQKTAEAEQESIKQLASDMAKDVSTADKVTEHPQHQHKMRESRVPSSRMGRLFEYGGLAASMAFGAVGESITRSGGPGGSLMLSAANMERLVSKLSKMRGAALKLGQMMSFQDSKMLPKPIHDVLQRVQDSADYMPASQRDAVISADLGPSWRDLFEQFDEKPMAAASIGQVHGAVLQSNGQRVAVKVQYPGVADSISSDLNNLSLLLTASKLLPKGLYLDKTIANARTELAWECDYLREAECAKKFQTLLADETDVFTVPSIIDEASGKQVLTMEMMEGVAVTKIQNCGQEQRDWIGSQILRLCFREITEFKYMQTDPNWTNFLYNTKSKKLELLDFGASREYPDKFIVPYVKVLAAAARGDRKACEDYSIQLGYLTGYESKTMLRAHVDSIMTLAEPFTNAAPDEYDFKDQDVTDRVRALIPVMLRERLAPPPEETYSLHRKLSGAFLLCARLGSRVRCKEMFQQALQKAGIS